MIVYHGSNTEIRNPDYQKGREDTDFGQGFYVTDELLMASKWAARKSNAAINTYELDTSGLKIKQLDLNEEWLDFIIANRQMEEPDRFNGYDVIVGATADDKMFATIENYENGFISSKDAIRILNNMEVGTQMCLKTQKAVEALSFIRSETLNKEQQNKFRIMIKEDRAMANEMTAKMMREAVRAKETVDVSGLSPKEQKEVKELVDQKRRAKNNKRKKETEIEL